MVEILLFIHLFFIFIIYSLKNGKVKNIGKNSNQYMVKKLEWNQIDVF